MPAPRYHTFTYASQAVVDDTGGTAGIPSWQQVPAAQVGFWPVGACGPTGVDRVSCPRQRLATYPKQMIAGDAALWSHAQVGPAALELVVGAGNALGGHHQCLALSLAPVAR